MAAAFTITNQKQGQIIGPDGVLIDSMRVEFTTTASGVVGYIDVPLDQYTTENVSQLVGDRVAIIDQVQGL